MDRYNTRAINDNEEPANGTYQQKTLKFMENKNIIRATFIILRSSEILEYVKRALGTK
jgi:hypothetical protein